MLRLPAPAALNGDQLSAELHAAGVPSDVGLSGDDLLVFDADESQEQAVSSVVAAHQPAPSAPADPDADLAAAITAVDTSKIADAATRGAVDALKAALIGKGKPAAVAGRHAR
jgi:hypothetical protein